MTGRQITAAWAIFDDDGQCLEQSEAHNPMRYTEGDNTLFPALAEALQGIEAGEERTVYLKHEQAHGPYMHNLVFEVVNANLPEGITPYPGMTFSPGGQRGRFQLRVLDVLEDGVKVDGNHRYAGMALEYRVHALSVFENNVS
ncbi:MAG: peptidylprolyl isomerase [Marinobacter sp.]